MLREVYTGLGGGTVAALMSSPGFPDGPTDTSVVPNFETPENTADGYGQRLSALLRPTVTGTYYFYIASDDGSELWLSTNEQPGTRQLIASVNGWTSYRNYNANPSQRSGPINLVAGMSYYIETLHAEGAGGDHLSVTWQLPGQAAVVNGAAPIPGTYLQPYLTAPVFTVQPTSTTVVENSSVSFSVRLARGIGTAYQWKRNGTNVPGATQNSLTLASVRVADSGSTFTCLASNPYGSTNSSAATLTVTRDITPPAIVRAGLLADPSAVIVTFSEPVSEATATAAANYTIPGVTISKAELLDDGITVVLTTSGLTVGQAYQLNYANVRDLAELPNTITAGSRALTTGYAPADMTLLTGAIEPAGPSSRASGLAITEIMYHPAARSDGRNVEFVEIFNSNLWPEDLSGYRLAGEVGYSFPQGTTIPALGYRVVAPSPVDVQTVYGITGVLGPLTNSSPGNVTNTLSNGTGTIELRDELGSVLVRVDYDDETPWPVAADGAGHSLVLVRPSYGAADPYAWAASDVMGGSPQRYDTAGSNPYRPVVINEILAHTDEPQYDYVELFNYSGTPIDVSGLVLTDDAETNKFILPPNTVIPAAGFVTFDQLQLGFALSAEGETVYLVNPAANRVIDAVDFGPQENGVAYGRYPDGARGFHRLAAPTKNDANKPLLISPVVINELMYHPVSEDDDQEFVEIFNRSASPVNISQWRLRGGISFNIPQNTVLGAGEHIVVAKDRLKLLAVHPSLPAAKALGDFSGKLSNSGEAVALLMPDDLVSTNAANQRVTNQIYIAVDQVAYGTGGRWGPWADGGGSSLELRDPRSDHRLAPNWADSDESAKSGWTTVEFTGVLDLGGIAPSPSQLHLMLLGPGECLVDNVQVIPQAGGNLVANSTFESGTAGWVFQGSHQDSRWENAQGDSSSASLRVVASDRGDTGANRIRFNLSSAPATGSTVTLRARVKYIQGHPELLLRLYGNWLEASGNTLTTSAFGTPGARNSRYTTNAGPAITRVTHSPVLPQGGQSVTVYAAVHDPDGLASVSLYYRMDPSDSYTALPMAYRGAGLFAATIPAQTLGSQVAFYLAAYDNGTPRQSSRFPALSAPSPFAPQPECLVRWGEPTPAGQFPAYRLWVAQTNVTRWSTRERNSNHPLDATFVLGNTRVFYNVHTLYSGSPFHTPGYTSPAGNLCDYEVNFPKDDLLLGADDFVLGTIGNINNDPHYQSEQLAFWIGRKLGAPYLNRRYIRVFFNGVQRAQIYEDAQQPDRDIVQQWWPDDSDGDLHKIEDWFEFGENGDTRLGNVDATLQNFTTAGGVKKTARYRWTWRPRAVRESSNDFTNLFALVDTMSVPNPDPRRISLIMDVDRMTRVLAMERIVGNWDSYGYDRGKNMYAYKPLQGQWTFLPWDIDMVMASGGRAADAGLFGANDPVMTRFLQIPEIQRAYWRAFEDAVNGPMVAATFNARVDQRASVLINNGVPAQNGQAQKDYIAARRTFIMGELARVTAPFNVTSSTSFSTNRNLVTISGVAPVGMATLLINGQPVQPNWTSVTNWSLIYALAPGQNSIAVSGLDRKGNTLAAGNGNLTINYSGTVQSPRDMLAINEIMYNPQTPRAGFIEIHNRSAANAFDLSNWRISGADCDIPFGTVIQPGAYLVFVEDPSTFLQVYGQNVPIAGVFNGKLDDGGETLTLLRPLGPVGSYEVIDQVTYDDDPPWPVAADGAGGSLQLIDAIRDNNRVANWAAMAASPGVAYQMLIDFTSSWKYEQTQNLDGVNWTAPAYQDTEWPSGAGLLYVETSALPYPKNTPLTIGRTTYYFRAKFNYSGPTAGVPVKLSTVIDDGAIFYLNGQEIFRQNMNASAYSSLATNSVGEASVTGPFNLVLANLVSGTNVLAVEVHQGTANSSDIVFGCQLVTDPTAAVNAYTPGARNTLAANLPEFPPLWLNEILTQNPGDYTDAAGDSDPWVELYYAGTSNAPGTFFLSDSLTNLTRWPIPQGRFTAPQFLPVWLDAEPAESTPAQLHANFRPGQTTGTVALAWSNSATVRVLDYLHYDIASAGRSYGDYPDGNVSRRQSFSITTPGATNNPADAPVTLFINEWLADNLSDLRDPVDGNFEDWFEIYNPRPQPIDIGGYYLTDVLTNKTKWLIPDGTFVPANGFLLVWADGEPGQNTGTGHLHADLSLAKGGEAIALYAPAGTLVDAVTFGPQVTDVTQGRFPDGSSTIITLANSSPGQPNQAATVNSPPVLSPVANLVGFEGALFTFTAQATDPDNNALTFSLAGAPAGASIHPASGVFAWVPSEPQGPGSYSLTLAVSDNGSPPLSATRQFSIQVNESNNPPVITVASSHSVNESNLLSFVVAASDQDLPAQNLSFSILSGAPGGMIIHPQTGVLTWTPSEAQAPANHSVTIQVADDGEPQALATTAVTIVAQEVNLPPVLHLVPSRTNHAGSPFVFTVSATDPDLPANQLAYSLAGDAPEGAVIDPSTGLFSWLPTAPATNFFQITVSDASLTASQSVTLTVYASLEIASATLFGDSIQLSWTAIPGASYQAQSAPAPAGPWSDDGQAVTATSSTATLTRTTTNAQMFYRLLLR